MNHQVETGLRLFLASTVLGAAIGCRPVLSQPLLSPPTPESPSAAPYPDSFHLTSNIPVEIPLLRGAPTANERSVTPTPTFVPYELPGGFNLDTPSPVTMSITLPDKQVISSTFTFKTNSTECEAGQGQVCVYQDPLNGRIFILAHSGRLKLHDLEAEFIRKYLEGPLFYTSSPQEVAQKLAALPGSQITFKSENHIYTSMISFAIRVSPDQVARFSENLLNGPEVAAEIFSSDPILTKKIRQSQLLFVFCGRRLVLEKSPPDGTLPSNAARYVIGIDFPPGP